MLHGERGEERRASHHQLQNKNQSEGKDMELI